VAKILIMARESEELSRLAAALTGAGFSTTFVLDADAMARTIDEEKIDALLISFEGIG